MYKIYRNNEVIATTDRLVYIKKHPTNDSFVPAEESDAEGIAVQSSSQVFALMGNKIKGLEQVVVVEADGGTLIDNTNADVEHIADILSVDIISNMSEKDRAIAVTNRWLKNELRKGMVWEDGNTYTITDRKQSNLLSQLVIGSVQVINGADPNEVTLRWNETGKPQTDWKYADLCKLAYDIRDHVDSLVVKQQKAEEQIVKAKTDDKVEKVLRGFHIDEE